MGNLFKKLWGKLMDDNQQYKIIILGLANAGKTSLLYRLKLGSVVESHPTIGSNYEEIQFKNIHLQTWDLGGQESLRKIWDCYYKGAKGIVFVIDSSDKQNFETAKQELNQLFKDSEIKNSIFLILANKQDLDNSLQPDEIVKEFKLNEVQENTWSIYGISVKNGDEDVLNSQFLIMKKLNMILCSTRNMGIGMDNQLPWKLKKDLKFFQQVTTQGQNKNCIIMGYNTYQSIGKELPNRYNLILTTKNKNSFLNQETETLKFFNTFEEIQNFTKNIPGEDFVIGGGKIYDMILQNERLEMDKLYWTRIQNDINCDAFVNKQDFLKLKKKLGNPLVSKTYQEKDIHFDWVVYGNHNQNSQIFQEISEEYQYLNLLRKILNKGHQREDRTGEGTIGLFGELMRFDLKHSFPLLTTKKVFTRGIIEELLWFIKGQTDADILRKKKVHIWDGNGNREFLDKRGLVNNREWDLGPVYGFQWRNFGAQYQNCDFDHTGQGIDQLENVIESLKNNPYGRRHLVSAWNPLDLNKMALPPCHVLFQFYVQDKTRLSCSLYQRSGDVGLGIPFNIASYSLLLCIMADYLGYERGEFVHFIGDTHIYNNHIEPLKEQIQRSPKPFPLLNINQRDRKNIEDYSIEDFQIENYYPLPKIHMDMSAQIILSEQEINYIMITKYLSLWIIFYIMKF